MDIYTEYIIKKKKDTKDYVIIVLSVILGIVLSLAFMLLNALILGLGVLLAAFTWYGVYLIINSRNLEYEYILTNGELDIDKIIAKNGRKRIITINFKEVELCANIHNPEFKHQYENENNLSQKLVLVGDKNADNIYFADFYSDGERKRVLFQPTEKIVDGLAKANPRNVHA